MFNLLVQLPIWQSNKIDWDTMTPALLQAISETLYMVSITLAIGGVCGLILGCVLWCTRKGSLFSNPPIYRVLEFVVNLIRPVPFIIFLSAVQPATIAVVGTSLGTNAAIFPMAIFCTMATSRIVEQSLINVDYGVIEASFAVGASRIRTLFEVVIPEVLPPLILGYAFIFIGIMDMSAMAGTIGGGGLGDFAIQYGYNKFNPVITWISVVIILIIVQCVQQLANFISRKLLSRN
ncbi:MAG: ABC transporter permease [Bifidobacteriaceae bacterium]|jgi:D-methionine transport system permease protein|nr:ABC transporter permease [Bifidobacteriaceae bacterium]